jgi:ABC-type uncharacterized transport system substrate-binding protein
LQQHPNAVAGAHSECAQPFIIVPGHSIGIRPIVFETPADPVQLGLVANLHRPGGNITGVTQLNIETTPISATSA